MDTTQIVILTILGIAAFVTFCSLIYRMAELSDDLWVEPLVLAVLALFAYLVAR